MLEISHSPVLSALWGHAEKDPSKTALVWNDATVSYGELRDKIIEAANYLVSKGVRSGDCLGIVAKKGLDFVYLYFAGQLIGAVNVVLDPEANEKRLEYIREMTKPKFIAGGDEALFDCLSSQDCLIDRGADYGTAYQSNNQAISNQTIKQSRIKQSNNISLTPDLAAEIVFTTGTTGAAKGVVLTHANIYGSASNINSFIGNGPDEVEILGLPLCHSFGLGRLRCTLLKGATLVVLPNFANVKAFFAAIEKYHATGFGMVPAIWAYIRKISGKRIAKYAPQIKYIEIGSAAMPLESKKELCELFPTTRICHHYGLTEASRATFMEYHECIDDLKTIGREASDLVSVKIFNEQGVEIPDGEPGEMCVKGNMVTKGYLKPEENATAYFGEYFRTGDGGYRGPNGNLYLVSRLKELINVGGKKVSPVEVEDAIIALGVEDCVVVGVPDPDGILGEVPKCYLLKSGTSLSFDEIRVALVGKLEPYKIPMLWGWIDAVPKTSSGKKQRLHLKG